jgi:hypothetical protein
MENHRGPTSNEKSRMPLITIECNLVQHRVPKADFHVGLSMVLTDVDTTVGKKNKK